MVEVTDLHRDGVVDGINVADGPCYDEAMIKAMADRARTYLDQPRRHAEADGSHRLSFHFDRFLRVEEVAMRLQLFPR